MEQIRQRGGIGVSGLEVSADAHHVARVMTSQDRAMRSTGGSRSVGKEDLDLAKQRLEAKGTQVQNRTRRPSMTRRRAWLRVPTAGEAVEEKHSASAGGWQRGGEALAWTRLISAGEDSSGVCPFLCGWL